MISTAAFYLREGKLVAIPTETVYGLAGNAFDEEAIRSVFRVKNRPLSDPLIVHCHSLEQIYELVTEFPSEAKALAHSFWPGPLTLLLPKSKKISPLITAGHERVAIRIPNHPVTLELLARLEFPLVAPSANPFGYISPTTADHVRDQLGNQIAYILDGGPCTLGIESTIVGFEKGQLKIYRQGAIPEEKIGAITAHSPSSPVAPGMLKSHYAPRKQLLLGKIEELIKLYPKAAICSFSTRYRDPCVVLSPSANLDEAAHNLFAALRLLDKTDAPLIIAEELPSIGIGRAINDRLHKAACK